MHICMLMAKVGWERAGGSRTIQPSLPARPDCVKHLWPFLHLLHKFCLFLTRTSDHFIPILNFYSPTFRQEFNFLLKPNDFPFQISSKIRVHIVCDGTEKNCRGRPRAQLERSTKGRAQKRGREDNRQQTMGMNLGRSN